MSNIMDKENSIATMQQCLKCYTRRAREEYRNVDHEFMSMREIEQLLLEQYPEIAAGEFNVEQIKETTIRVYDAIFYWQLFNDLMGRGNIHSLDDNWEIHKRQVSVRDLFDKNIKELEALRIDFMDSF